jgi:ankyrin repeat protein
MYHIKKNIMSNIQYINIIKHQIEIKRLLPIHDDVISILKNYILDTRAVNKCFIYAAENGYLEVVKYLHDDIKDISVNTSGYNAVKWASYYGHLEVVKYLHQNGADITAENNFAVRLAAYRGHLEVVKYLHQNGANIIDRNNYTIRWAAGNGHLKVVKYLRDNGADIYNIYY